MCLNDCQFKHNNVHWIRYINSRIFIHRHLRILVVNKHSLCKLRFVVSAEDSTALDVAASHVYGKDLRRFLNVSNSTSTIQYRLWQRMVKLYISTHKVSQNHLEDSN